MVTVSEADNAVSLAVSCNTYVPSTEKVTAVPGEPGFANVTVPGPLTLLQAAVTAAPAGSPSTVTVPANIAPGSGRTAA